MGKFDKYKKIRCNSCGKTGGIIPIGRVYKTFGKKEFKCLVCNKEYQYGT